MPGYLEDRKKGTEVWSGSAEEAAKQQNRVLAGLPCLRSKPVQKACSGEWDWVTRRARLSYRESQGLSRDIYSSRSHVMRRLPTANWQCFLGNTADICYIWSSHFHTGYTLTSFLTYTWTGSSRLCIVWWHWSAFPYLFFPSFLGSSHNLWFHSLLHSGQKF